MWEDVLDIGPQCDERFVGKTRVPEVDALGIQLSGVSYLSGVYRVGRTKPTAHTLLYSVEGEGLLHTEAGRQPVEKQRLVTLPAGQPFLLEISSPRWVTAWIDLEDNPHWRGLCRDRPAVEYCEPAMQIFHLLSLVYFERRAELRRPALDQLDFYLTETLTAAGNAVPESHRVDLLFREVEKRLHYAWSIDDFCETVHYSASHLHRLCQQRFGRSPIQQLIHLRMERAKYFLRHTTWTIENIASRVGYQDIFSFSKRFKKTVGVSPSAYRKHCEGA